MTRPETPFRRLGVVVASSLGVMATSKIVEIAASLGDDSVVSVIGELATVPAVVATGVAAQLGWAWLAERNNALADERQEQANAASQAVDPFSL